ncbi:MAG: hypothetical protein QM642_01930 [Edaphocola sp.]
MTIKLQPYENGYLGVSDEEIKAGDYIIGITKNNSVCYFPQLPLSYIVNDVGFITINNENNPFPLNGKNLQNDFDRAYKILFTTPDLELEGVPLIDLKLENVELLAKEETDAECRIDSSLNYTGYYKGFQRGYNKAKELYKYTEEDVLKVIELARVGDRSWDGFINPEFTKNEILQQLSPKIPVSVEVETEILHSPTDPANYYDVEIIKTQTINGKEYVIIKKINYEN